MTAFDRYINDVHVFSDSMRQKDCAFRQFDCLESPEELGEALPIEVGPGANPGIILRGDAFLELGNPTAGSCAYLLWTDKPSLIRDGRITVIGPDISESEGASLPFGQVLMLAGEALLPKDHERLQQVPIVGDRIHGYMVRSAAENVWSRVSKSVAARGFDFEMLGKSMLRLVKSGTQGITAMEILFVTSSKEDVNELSKLASGSRAIGSEILKEAWKARGYDVDCDFDCASCQNEEVCDDIRDVVVTLREKAAKSKTEQESERRLGETPTAPGKLAEDHSEPRP